MADLFSHHRETQLAQLAPLADRMRPRTLEEFQGQEAILGPGRLLRRAILDKDVRVPAGLQIGVDPEEDAARGLTVSAAGVTVVPKGHVFDELALPVAARVAHVH